MMRSRPAHERARPSARKRRARTVNLRAPCAPRTAILPGRESARPPSSTQVPCARPRAIPARYALSLPRERDGGCAHAFTRSRPRHCPAASVELAGDDRLVCRRSPSPLLRTRVRPSSTRPPRRTPHYERGVKSPRRSPIESSSFVVVIVAPGVVVMRSALRAMSVPIFGVGPPEPLLAAALPPRDPDRERLATGVACSVSSTGSSQYYNSHCDARCVTHIKADQRLALMRSDEPFEHNSGCGPYVGSYADVTPQALRHTH